jgi:tetrapyrrole methylase family protein/MazG family protein
MQNFELKEKYDLNDFIALMALLRSENGCPWDAIQTHESIRRNLLEEAYEACEAIDEGDPEHLKEELGDLLMQVLFHSRMEEEIGSFNIQDVADAACQKLVRRHPHIFADAQVNSPDEVLDKWDEIKQIERGQQPPSSVMDSVAKSLPSLWLAEKVQGKAANVGFDWPEITGALEKIDEELSELRAAIDSGRGIAEEIGDLLFSVVNVSRFVDVDPEMALSSSVDKFISRFRHMEYLAADRGQTLEQLSLDEMEELYQSSKSNEAQA